MKKNVINIIVLVVAVAALVLGVVNRLSINNNEVTVYYVDNHKVFDEFKMTKEYDQLMGQKFLQKEAFVDSLRFSLQVLEKKLKTDTSKVLLKEFYRKRNQFSELSEEVGREKQKYIAETKSKIWTRLNELLIEYGEENNCQIILGASGNGNIMYGNPDLDLTEDVIQYVNLKYDNGN